MHIRSGIVSRGPVPLHYVEWGEIDAPPVVLLHGLRAYGYWFEEFAEVASKRLRLIALDQRGRGASGWAHPSEYTTDHYVADVDVLAAALGLARFALVGHSMGGTNALHYSARNAQRVSALVLVDTAPELDQRGVDRIRAEVSRTPQSFPSLAAARAFLRTIHVRPSERSIDTRLEWMLRMDERGVFQWRIDPRIFDPNFFRPDPPERAWQALPKVQAPTLFVRGAITDLVTPEMAQRVVKTLARAELVEIAAAGHMVVEDNPADFTKAVVPFLEKMLLR